MKKQQKADLEQAMRLVSGFAWSLCDRGLSPDFHGVFAPRSAVIMSFTRDERDQYFRCLSALSRVTYGQPIGDATLRSLLEDALLHAIDGPNDGAEQRIAVAVTQLGEQLFGSSTSFKVAYRIQWMAPAELPFRYQQVLFIPVDDAQLSSSLDITTGGRLDEAVRQFLPEEREGMAVAVLDVLARDEASARAIALNRVHDAVDELTGLTALTQHLTSPVVTDVFNALRVSLVTIVVRSSDEATVHVPLPLPSDIVRPKRLFDLLGEHVSSSRRKVLLGEASDGDLSLRIRSAARYLGRAQQCRFESRTADAFLYYVVAMEALLGKQDYRDSIGYQLRMRVAHLIGTTPEERCDIEREVLHLYKIRSKLVHSGTREVHPFDLTNAGIYAVRSIGAALFANAIKDFTKFEQLEEWFRVRLLA